MNNNQEQDYTPDSPYCQPTKCEQMGSEFYDICPFCQLNNSKDALCPLRKTININFQEAALLELREINQFMGFSKAVYEITQAKIKDQAKDHEHMKVNQFVDMCLDLARIERHEMSQ